MAKRRITWYIWLRFAPPKSLASLGTSHIRKTLAEMPSNFNFYGYETINNR